ncbi:MAG TPA: hypothetical protein VEN79_13425 [Terriglobia bacterium]|nr:hypothetical protein [Terriglobia bacterium]
MNNKRALLRSKIDVFLGLTLMVVWITPASLGQSSVRTEFISLESAQPVLEGMRGILPPDLKAVGPLDATKWSAWVQLRDRQVRNRLIRGEEDTLVNLLRFGVTFTKEYRIDDEFLVRYGQSSLVNAFAENRANDLIHAWMAPSSSEGLIEMRTFAEKHGHSIRTAQERTETKQYLLDSLARLRDEYLKYKSQPKDERRFQMFVDRGISLDTNLWPDFLLDAAFRSLLKKGMLNAGGVRRIAIVGPGLDFANKEAGNDFYPPQTIQPFAVLDSLIRLGIASPRTVELDTLDISDNVNVHVARIRQAAVQGRSYILQLPWNAERPMSEEYRAHFVEYWQKLGEEIGQPVAPIAVPEAAASTQTRAVKVRPNIVERVTPLDIDVVYQRLTLPADRAYDLVIGTNIFLYYGMLEQALARANLSAMLRPGGFLISNDKLADNVPSGLKDDLEVSVDMSEQPLIQDIVFCYQHTN